jgi:RHS repeat-associated protein
MKLERPNEKPPNYGLTPLNGSTARLNEQFGYSYDAASNLRYRTNNAVVETFTVNNLNELTTLARIGTLTVAGAASEPAPQYSGDYGTTNVTVADNGNTPLPAAVYADGTFARANVTAVDGSNTFTAIARDQSGRADTNTVTAQLPLSKSFAFDSRGNLTSDGGRYFTYDDENQLVAATVSNAWRSEFHYDGKMRRRVEKEFTWSITSTNWLQTNEVRQIYDDMLVIEDRDESNMRVTDYTRGKDLMGGRQSGGGIGGLLARTDYSSTKFQSSPSDSYYYHCDGNGNITGLVDAHEKLVGAYSYDPFGRAVAIKGFLGKANASRYSSKHEHPSSGLYWYGFRYYDSQLQRWLSRDPADRGEGANAYGYVANLVMSRIDPFGLSPTDVEDILATYYKALQEMNNQGHRVGWCSPLSSLKSDIWWGKYGKGWECVTQSKYVVNALNKQPRRDDDWTIQTVSSPLGTHTWVEATSTNPGDPIIKLDPWWGVPPGLTPNAITSTPSPTPISNVNANSIPNVPIPGYFPR